MENRRLSFLSSLILFRQEPDGLLYRLCADSNDPAALSRLVACAVENSWDGNLWHCCIAQALVESVNPFSLRCERRRAPDDSLYQLALRDAQMIIALLNAVPEGAPWNVLGSFRRDISIPDNGIGALAQALAAVKSADGLLQVLTAFYQRRGVGLFALHDVFRVEDGAGECTLLPVRERRQAELSDLVGYEAQKKQLMENTKAFVAGAAANNVLLYGDAGTGKSTSVQALVSAYAEGGLRMVEVYPHQYTHLPSLLGQLRQRNYRFILLLDDLSFEENETAYKYLKAMLEGGAEGGAENVRIYATSNRRHLVRETWSDRSDMEHSGDVHRSDTMEEKLSLASRFGLQIFYAAPSFDEYQNIVSALYQKNNQDSVKLTPEQLRSAAATWQVRSGSRSGRTARQFVDTLYSQDGDN